MKKLTPRQKEYARQRAAGKTYKEAYKAAGYSNKGNDKTLLDNAYNLEHKNTDVLQRIKDLQARADAGGIMDRQARMQLLNDIALNPAVKDQDRLRAVDQLNRMNADYTDRVNVTGTASIDLTYADRIEAIKKAMEDA